MPTPTSLLFDVLAKSCLSLFELTDSRFELIIVQAIRNMPIPAMRDKTAVAIWTGVILIVFARPYVREERYSEGYCRFLLTFPIIIYHKL